MTTQVETKNALELLTSEWVGKVFIAREYSEGEYDPNSGKVITDVSIGMDESREDGVIWITVDNDGGRTFFVYGREGVTVK